MRYANFWDVGYIIIYMNFNYEVDNAEIPVSCKKRNPKPDKNIPVKILCNRRNVPHWEYLQLHGNDLLTTLTISRKEAPISQIQTSQCSVWMTTTISS